MLTPLESRLLHGYRNHFPFAERPFLRVADQLGVSEEEVLNSVASLLDRGLIRRIGPAFSPNAVDVQATVAAQVPDEKLGKVLASVCFCPEISLVRIYRDQLNLWFRITCDSLSTMCEMLDSLSELAACQPLILVHRREVEDGTLPCDSEKYSSADTEKVVSMQKQREWSMGDFHVSAPEKRVIRAVRAGLPINSRPYNDIADRLGIRRRELTDTLQVLFRCGVIRRWGVISGHAAFNGRSHALMLLSQNNKDESRVMASLGTARCVVSAFLWQAGEPEWSYDVGAMLYAASEAELHSEVRELMNQPSMASASVRLLMPAVAGQIASFNAEALEESLGSPQLAG